MSRARVKGSSLRARGVREWNSEELRTDRIADDDPSTWLTSASGTRPLLLEILRRAALDWVLYRESTHVRAQGLARLAHTWLFVEKPGHADWGRRQEADKALTSFLSICDALDLDPHAVRARIQTLSLAELVHVGRPAESRKSEAPADDTPLPLSSREMHEILDAFLEDACGADPMGHG